MHFISELPKCEGYDNILVIVDKLTKYAIFIPTTITITKKETAELFFQHVISQYGILQTGTLSGKGSSGSKFAIKWE